MVALIKTNKKQNKKVYEEYTVSQELNNLFDKYFDMAKNLEAEEHLYLIDKDSGGVLHTGSPNTFDKNIKCIL